MQKKPAMASFNIPPRRQIVIQLEALQHKANLAQPKQAACITLLQQACSLARKTCKAMQTSMKQTNQLIIYKKNTRIITLHICVQAIFN